MGQIQEQKITARNKEKGGEKNVGPRGNPLRTGSVENLFPENKNWKAC